MLEWVNDTSLTNELIKSTVAQNHCMCLRWNAVLPFGRWARVCNNHMIGMGFYSSSFVLFLTPSSTLQLSFRNVGSHESREAEAQSHANHQDRKCKSETFRRISLLQVQLHNQGTISGIVMQVLHAMYYNCFKSQSKSL